MSSEQLSFESDEDPWKDPNTLQGLYHGDDMNQTEIAEYLTENGHKVTASSISYWMGKHGIQTTHTKHENRTFDESRQCVKCGDETPGPNNGMCDDCLSAVRKADSNTR